MVHGKGCANVGPLGFRWHSFFWVKIFVKNLFWAKRKFLVCQQKFWQFFFFSVPKYWKSSTLAYNSPKTKSQQNILASQQGFWQFFSSQNLFFDLFFFWSLLARWPFSVGKFWHFFFSGQHWRIPSWRCPNFWEFAHQSWSCEIFAHHRSDREPYDIQPGVTLLLLKMQFMTPYFQ